MQISQPKKVRKQNKHTFTLKGIDINEIDNKFGLQVASVLDERKEFIPTNVTKIEELTHAQNNQGFFFSFIDDTHKHCITMIDSITKKSIQVHHCFWCKHAFSTVPVGCPLRYVSHKIVQTHTSEITKEKYIIQQKITKNEYKRFQDDGLDDISFMPNDYYETDGSFCSFNCCLAFIRDNVHNSKYSNSKYLLMNMYTEIFCNKPSVQPVKIVAAPSWRLLAKYGGHMDIQQFRDSFSNYIYIDNKHNISQLPKTLPVGQIFEKHWVF